MARRERRALMADSAQRAAKFLRHANAAGSPPPRHSDRPQDHWSAGATPRSMQEEGARTPAIWRRQYGVPPPPHHGRARHRQARQRDALPPRRRHAPARKKRHASAAAPPAERAAAGGNYTDAIRGGIAWTITRCVLWSPATSVTPVAPCFRAFGGCGGGLVGGRRGGRVEGWWWVEVQEARRGDDSTVIHGWPCPIVVVGSSGGGGSGGGGGGGGGRGEVVVVWPRPTAITAAAVLHHEKMMQRCSRTCRGGMHPTTAVGYIRPDMCALPPVAYHFHYLPHTHVVPPLPRTFPSPLFLPLWSFHCSTSTAHPSRASRRFQPRHGGA